jgi:aminoglycoside phosphotransferase (APT) family kinase protein
MVAPPELQKDVEHSHDLSRSSLSDIMHKSAIDIGTAALRDIVRSINHSWTLTGFRRVESGIVNPVYELTIEPYGFLILKIGNPEWDSWKVDNEVLASRLIRLIARVPTPDILSVDTSKRILPYSYFVMERLAGCPLSDVINQLPLEQAKQIVRRITLYLKRIHGIELPRFGALRHDGSLEIADMITLRQRSPTTFAGPFDSVREYYAAFVEARWQEVQISQLKPEAALLCQFIRDRLHLLAGQAGPTLVHGDFQPSNIFVEAGAVTGIIDSEWAHSGCGEAEWFVARQRLLAAIDDPIRCEVCAREFDAQCDITDPVQYRERCMLYEADDCLNSIEAFPWLIHNLDADGARQIKEGIRARVRAFERACV